MAQLVLLDFFQQYQGLMKICQGCNFKENCWRKGAMLFMSKGLDVICRRPFFCIVVGTTDYHEMNPT